MDIKRLICIKIYFDQTFLIQPILTILLECFDDLLCFVRTAIIIVMHPIAMADAPPALNICDASKTDSIQYIPLQVLDLVPSAINTLGE